MSTVQLFSAIFQTNLLILGNHMLQDHVANWKPGRQPLLLFPEAVFFIFGWGIGGVTSHHMVYQRLSKCINIFGLFEFMNTIDYRTSNIK